MHFVNLKCFIKTVLLAVFNFLTVNDTAVTYNFLALNLYIVQSIITILSAMIFFNKITILGGIFVLYLVTLLACRLQEARRSRAGSRAYGRRGPSQMSRGPSQMSRMGQSKQRSSLQLSRKPSLQMPRGSVLLECTDDSEGRSGSVLRKSSTGRVKECNDDSERRSGSVLRKSSTGRVKQRSSVQLDRKPSLQSHRGSVVLEKIEDIGVETQEVLQMQASAKRGRKHSSLQPPIKPLLLPNKPSVPNWRGSTMLESIIDDGTSPDQIPGDTSAPRDRSTTQMANISVAHGAQLLEDINDDSDEEGDDDM